MTAEETLKALFEIYHGSMIVEQNRLNSILTQAQSEAITKTVKMVVELIRGLAMNSYITDQDGEGIIEKLKEQLTPERVMGEK